MLQFIIGNTEEAPDWAMWSASAGIAHTDFDFEHGRFWINRSKVSNETICKYIETVLATPPGQLIKRASHLGQGLSNDELKKLTE